MHLVVVYKKSHYMGSLLFDDRVFCLHIYQVLINHCGKCMQEIGSIDLSYTLKT